MLQRRLNASKVIKTLDLLQARIEGELQAQVVAVEHPRPQAIRQGGAIGAAPQAAGGLMAPQVAVAALLQARLGHPLQVEEAHHIGEKRSLRIDALGIGLEDRKSTRLNSSH